MAADPDAVLLETVRTHRARLHAALVHGELVERRTVDDNVRRLLVSTVLAAVACAGCVGYAVVADVLAHPDKASTAPAGTARR